MAGDRWTIYTAGDGQLCDGGYGDAIAFAPEGAIWFGTMRFQPARMGGVQ
jgi:hypothetical protein